MLFRIIISSVIVLVAYSLMKPPPSATETALKIREIQKTASFELDSDGTCTGDAKACAKVQALCHAYFEGAK